MRIPFTPAETNGIGSGATEEKKFGTGEPAFPRVPASSGPPVPFSSPATPARIPFSFSAPSDEVWKHARASEEEPPGASSSEPEPTAKTGIDLEAALRSAAEDSGGYSEPILTLPLRPILEHLPPMQLGGSPNLVSSEATVSFPMSMIAPQLASGRVALEPKAFYAALPAEYRKLFLPDAVNAPVQLPLPDVLTSLPNEALRIRADQEVGTVEEIFETPFAAKAAEDAARLGRQAAAETPGSADEGEEQEWSEKPEGEIQRSRGGNKPKLKAEPDQPSAPEFSAKDAVEKASALAGVESCSVIFSDGLSIAGNIPDSIHIEGLSAVAPTLLQKLDKHMLQTSLGPLLGVTVHGGDASASFFTAGNVCLTALHRGRDLCAQSRDELGRLTEELSRAYSATGQSGTGGPSRRGE
jgi:predicted regulator of Ras-like GTPase activity (Roadblock/LC7/MglB family)